MTFPLLADMVVWPLYVFGGAVLLAGGLAAVGVVWLGLWWLRRKPSQSDPDSGDVW